jgi:hypothetical protein
VLNCQPHYAPVLVAARLLKLLGNPLTYEADAMRALMIQGSVMAYRIGMGFGVLIFALVALTTVSARL